MPARIGLLAWRRSFRFGSIAPIPLYPPLVRLASDSSPHLILIPAVAMTLPQRSISLLT
jgi:hypothetical protein